MKKHLFLFLVASIMFILNACSSVPSDEEIQSSIDKNIFFMSGSWNVSDSIKSVFVGKSKVSNKKYTIYYSHNGAIHDDIVLLRLDNGKWILEGNDMRRHRESWILQ